MAIPTKPLTIGGVVLGGGSAVVGGSYAVSKETAKSALSDVLLPKGEKFNSDWDKKVTLLNSEEDSKLTEDLKKIKSTTDTPAGTKRSKLQGWCDSNLEKTVSSIFQSKDEKLLKQIEKWCVLLISDKLGESWKLNVNDESSKSDWEVKLKTLKSHTGERLKLTKEIKKLKDKQESHADDWKTLRDICKSFYGIGFTGDDKDNWKLANKFCSKPSILEMLNGTELPETTDVSGDWDKKVTDGSTGNTAAKEDALKTKLGNSSNSNKNKDLKDWCKIQYKKPRDSKVDKKPSDDLLTEVKKLCALTIKEKLDQSTNNKVSISLENSGDEDWKTNAKTLRSHTGNSPKLNSELTGMKSQISEDGTGWEKLKNWCKENWNKGYKGAEQELWKLADKFCKKA